LTFSSHCVILKFVSTGFQLHLSISLIIQYRK